MFKANPGGRMPPLYGRRDAHRYNAWWQCQDAPDFDFAMACGGEDPIATIRFSEFIR